MNAYLAANPPDYGYRDVDNILDMLYNFYSENNPIDSIAIRKNYQALDSFLNRFTLSQYDQVLDILCDLCLQHEEQAFRAGILIGLRLFVELDSL